MITEKKDRKWVIIALFILYVLVIGSLIVKFNVIDFCYLLLLVFYNVKYISIKR